jgi:hypothetical protein
MACVFAVQVQNWLSITRVALQGYLESGNLSRYRYFVNSSGAVRVYHQLQSCHGCRSKSKNHDEPINFSTYDKSIVPRTISIIVVNYYS